MDEQKHKQRMIIFHPALAPYRIDQFNMLNELYDLEVVFLMNDISNFKSNVNIGQNKMIEECNFKISFLLFGALFRRRLIRFGILREIRSKKPDIVLGFEYSLITQYLILLKRTGIIKQKIGSFIDDSPDICNNVQSKLRKWVRNYLVEQIDFLVVLSKTVADFYQDNFNLNNKRVIISPILQLPERLRKNSVEIENFATQYIKKYELAGKKAILFVGRFIPEKALPLFLKTISSVLTSNKDLKLILVGEGNELLQITHIIKEERLENSVIIPGKFISSELYGWYACASGFVLPSLSETFGAVVNEALIFGLNVLCSCYAGSYTLITPDNGIVFNPSDSNDTKEKFLLFISKLKPVGEISLYERPPLVENQKEVFFREWGKVVQLI